LAVVQLILAVDEHGYFTMHSISVVIVIKL